MLFGKYINKFYVKYLALFLIGIAALICVDIANLKIPEYLGQLVKIFEAGNPLSQENKIWQIVIGVLITAAVLFVGRIVFRLTIFSASTNIQTKLREEMFEKASKLSLDFYQDNKVGTIMNYFMSDLEEIDDFLSWGTVSLIDAFFLSSYTIYKMFMLNWSLSLIAAVPIVLIIVWGFFSEIFMSKVWDKRQQSSDRLYDYVNENFMGIRVIKAFVNEVKEIHEFAKVARKNKEVNVKFARISTLFDVSIELIIALVLTSILGFGSYFVFMSKNNTPVAGIKIDVGDLVTFIGYFDTLIWPLIALGSIFSRRSRAKASLARITTFLDSKEDIVNPVDPITIESPKGEVSVRDLFFKYKEGKDNYIKGMSFEIKPGEHIGVVGRLGSGKSTIVNLLLKFYNVNDGMIFIDGVDINRLDVKNLREMIALVPQDNLLFSDTITNNIGFSKESVTEEEIVDVAKRASIYNDVMKFENKFETVSGERGVTLSGGQKQRISIARAYLKDAPILILDDSLSAVDTKTEEELLKSLKENRQNKTTILVSSRVSTVESLDKILVLKDGKVEAFDTHKNLLKISETYKKMVHLQQLEKEMESYHGSSR